MKHVSKRAIATLLGLALIGTAITVAGAAMSPAPALPSNQDAVSPANPPASASSALVLSPQQREAAGIVIATVERRSLSSEMSFPGEVQPNRYRSSLVSSRVPAVIQNRQAVLGQSVRQGQALATLFSVEVADAQASFLLAEREWRRVQDLGRDIVAGKRWIEAEVGRQQARARLLTYGLSSAQIESLARDGHNRTPGIFTLTAPQAGIVTADSFRIGEMVEAGKPLFEVADTSTVWVEARVDADLAATLAVGTSATVRVASIRAKAIVKQILPSLDEQTRTLGVRLEVPNPDRGLNPGQFVQVDLESATTPTGIVVPTDAVIRNADGGWVVFVEDRDGALAPMPVRVVQTANGQSQVEGLTAGVRIVTSGAFFLQSELSKNASGTAQ
ncbi:efflux RND transporter periplasmic adaptor subunit [Magnetospirillum molischianum]|uniref:Secretion protein HlyD n=1 Tax=Magnetospirillum molischianum DSM 120 TaxID=1150626 RepID=H8FSN2_MAGML